MQWKLRVRELKGMEDEVSQDDDSRNKGEEKRTQR